MKSVFKILFLILATIVLIVIVVFGYRDIPLETLKMKYGKAPSSFISIDGINIHYRDEGFSKDSIPLVLIHGTGSSLHTFEGWTNQLKKTRRVIRMDLPGYGLTGPFKDRNYTMDSYVEFIHEFLNAKSIHKCILGGNSLGGGIAWRYTARYPNKVSKLILIDASGYPVKAQSTPIAFQLAKIPIIKNLFTYITPKFIARKSVENVYADITKVNDTLVERYFELALRAGNRQAFIDRLSVENDINSYEKIKSITQNTLILWGEKDKLIPTEVALKFHKDLPNSTLFILNGLGHVPMEENPDKSLLPVLEFLRDTNTLY